MKGQEKMKIQHKGVEYEGIPASNAIGMALFESSGMRRLIDERCSYDPEKRTLSPGMVVKALIGPMFNITKKFPLYMVETAYSSAPTDRLFGTGVASDNLYDTALARGLDTLFDADLCELFTECAKLASDTYGFESHVMHMDCTDISFTGLEHLPDKDGAAVPRHNGHPKDFRTELLQYQLQLVTDSNRIIRYMKPYSGNVGDSTMDSETLNDLGRIFTDDELRQTIMVGDSKLPTVQNMAKMIDMGMFFVSKCSQTFKGKTRDKVRAWAESAVMKGGPRRGLSMADTVLDVEFSKDRTEKLRFVAFRWERKVDDRIESVRRDAEKRAESISKAVKSMRFRKMDDALKEFERIRPGPLDALSMSAEPVYFESDHPEDVPGWWELHLTMEIADRSVRRAAEMAETVVLVTNLPRPSGDGGAAAIRTASNLEVIEYYSQEYKVEQSFRLMKSGMGMNSIFLQTPSRENAMMFVISIAVLISNIADAMFRRAEALLDGRQLTMYRLAYEVQTTIVQYSRSENTLRLMGPERVTKGFFDITDTLGINPQYLLGYL